MGNVRGLRWHCLQLFVHTKRNLFGGGVGSVIDFDVSGNQLVRRRELYGNRNGYCSYLYVLFLSTFTFYSVRFRVGARRGPLRGRN